MKNLTNTEEIEQQISSIIEEYLDSEKRIESHFNKLQIALSSSLRLLSDSEKKTLDKLQGTSSDLSSYLFSIISELKTITNNHFLSLKEHTDKLSQMLLNTNRKH